MEAKQQDVPQPDLTTATTLSNPPSNKALSNENQAVEIQADIQATELKMSKLKDGSSLDVQHSINSHTPPNNNIYQVFSLHSIELCKQHMFPFTSTLTHINEPIKNREDLLKSISKDSSWSSAESLPDLLGGLLSNSQQQDRISKFRNSESEGGRKSGQSENSQRSDCESGIVSDSGDSEISTNSGKKAKKDYQGVENQEKQDWRKSEATQGHYSLVLGKNCITQHKRSNMEMSTNLEGWKKNKFRGETKRNKEEREKKRYKQEGGEAVEILINGHWILTPANSEGDFDVKGPKDSSKICMSPNDNKEFNIDLCNSFEIPPCLNSRISSPVLSQSSSLESLLALGIELFPSKERLHRSISLESCLNKCHSPDSEVVGSLASLGELNQGQEINSDRVKPSEGINSGTETSSGDLSQRTLDLLKRLENIQNPLLVKMKRSVSDKSIQSSQFLVSPSLGGQHTPLSEIFSTSWKEQPSQINETLSKVSLTELSSTEDSSMESENFVILRNQHHICLDPNMAANASSRSQRKQYHNGSRGIKGADDSDATSLSMVVNVSCTSACTDEDEDDSDLLSSSTLTLTEEELGVRDEQDGDDERVNCVSSGNDQDEDKDADDMETSYELGLEYMKRELQSWKRSLHTSASSSFKTEAGLLDELQCGSAPSSTFTYSTTQTIEINNKAGNNTASRKENEDDNRKNVTRSYISQFDNDMENGNVDHSCLHEKDEDDDLLQEESGLLTKKRNTLGELYFNIKTEKPVQDVDNLRAEMDSSSTRHICSSPSNELLLFSSKRASSLVGELRGELPCHSTILPTSTLLSPVYCRSHSALDNSQSIAEGRKAITIQEKFKFSSLVTEETRSEVRAKDSCLLSKKSHKSYSSCCNPSLLSPHPQSGDECEKEKVHDLVMEIIDMSSVALKSKKNQSDGVNHGETSGSVQDQSSTSLAHARDKVLEHSHRPLHLRKGDFYSYLSLSSHDSDCGEVSQCAEDKSSTPVPYSIPSYFTSTQALNRPSPELFPGTKQPTSFFQSAQLTKCSSPNLTTKNNIGCLDLKCFDCETTSVTDGSQAEQCSSPSLSIPPSPDIRNEEMLFEACTEEVYLGPPLCYSIVIKKKPQPFQQKLCLDTSLASGSELNKNAPSLSLEGPNSELDNRLTDHFFSKQGCGSFLVSPVPEPSYSSFSTSPLLGSNSSSSDDNLFSPLPVSTGAKEKQLSEDLYLSSDGIVGKVATPVSVSMPQEKRSSNEGPSYLNPWVRVALIESFATKCLADTKMLESNMGTVMTKISVCSSATNPLKDPATAATRINPKISCSAIRKPDREEGKTGKESDTQWTEEKEKRRKGWSSSQQEAKSTMMKQVSIPCICAISRHYTVLRYWTPILCFGDYF
ncbi:hypothetical protein AMECASPLE_012123 [Ameca splendens]|uniref:Alstrom syndrome protein 1 n=1 Tax=Ameca splendens TaxID=208324 RepID=A0ABV0YZ87_9TELE